MFSWLSNRLAGRSANPQVNEMSEQLYAAIVAQARQPAFYSELGLADTVPGRFELISLHMFIVLDRLNGEEGLEGEVAQQLVDVMFMDMDDVARETGVGDMGVGPRIKKLARSFQSRLEYYKEAIEGDSRGTLPDAIIEIHFKDNKEQAKNAGILADYVLASRAWVKDMSLEQMVKADPIFGELRV